MAKPIDIPRKIRELRKRAGYKAMGDFAKAMGYSGASSWQRYENSAEYRGGYLSHDILAKLEGALLGKGEPPITRHEILELGGPIQEQLMTAGDVVQLDIHAGAGNGGFLHVETDSKGQVKPEFVSGHWSFPDQIKAGMRNIRSIYALPVVGDSMEPTLVGGSVVFVDTRHRYPSPPDIYAVDFGHGLMVKRLEMVPQTNTIRIISDNNRYENYTLELDEQIFVHGRVVGWFQWRG